jgi:TonB family protein
MDQEDIMGTPSPELKQLRIRVLKRVHPDLAIDEQDRIRCEQLTKLANEAYQAGDIEALRAVLRPSQPANAGAKQLLPVVIAVVIVIWIGFSLYSVATPRHAVTNSSTAQAHVGAPDAGVRQAHPSKSYDDVIPNRISENLTPSTLAGTNGGASRGGSPRKVSLFTTIGHPSLDSSCVNSARQAATFGAPEWGHSLDLVNDCSYKLQDGQQVPLKTGPPVASSVEPSDLYLKQMRERLYQSFSNDERVDANVPAGHSAEMWFNVNRDGSLSNVRVGKPSGWDSLDYACVRAVQRTQTVGALPEDYKLRTLSATFACTYTGSNALPTSMSVDSAADRPDLYVGSIRNTTHE